MWDLIVSVPDHCLYFFLVDKTYCAKMLSEVLVIIICVNRYAMTTCNKASCQTCWKKHNDMFS